MPLGFGFCHDYLGFPMMTIATVMTSVRLLVPIVIIYPTTTISNVFILFVNIPFLGRALGHFIFSLIGLTSVLIY